MLDLVEGAEEGCSGNRTFDDVDEGNAEDLLKDDGTKVGEIDIVGRADGFMLVKTEGT